VASVVDRWGRLDILVANAHYGDTVVEPQTPFEEIPDERWRPTMRAVLEGPYQTVKAAAPTMREQRWGRVVLVSSAVVELGIVGAAAFSAAKAGLHGLTRSLARELGPCGVLVNVVMPSMTLTERIRQLPEPIRQGMTAQTLTGHLSEPEDVAAAVLFLCSAANGNVHGEVLHVTGGM
jgi:NAD(P)-dependent dehydrogenase (short-subunit alcohol dehydrogenase family)